MKRAFTILVMMIIAVSSYAQSSRRPASTTEPARSNRERVTSTTTTRTHAPRQEPARTRTTTTTTTTTRTSTPTRTTTPSRTTTTTRRSTPASTTPQRSTRHTTTTTATPHRSTTTTTPRRTTTTVTHRPSTSTTTRTTVNANRPVEHRSTRRYTSERHVVHTYRTAPREKSYRVHHHVYREPSHIDIIWTRNMHRDYVTMYPHVSHWNYSHGNRLFSISAYDAEYHIGEVARVYGKVSEVFYARETDEYILYVGPYYPYHDFSVVVPGHVARRYSHRPTRYFNNHNISVTGLISVYNGIPEVVVKRNHQLSTY